MFAAFAGRATVFIACSLEMKIASVRIGIASGQPCVRRDMIIMLAVAPASRNENGPPGISEAALHDGVIRFQHRRKINRPKH
jgi:hypothetical protein